MALLTFLSLWIPPTVMAADGLLAGAARVDITPPVGFRKGGGYNEIISTGIHDRLFAKSLTLKQGNISAAIVISDLLSVPAELSEQARQQIGEKTGIPVSNIIIDIVRPAKQVDTDLPFLVLRRAEGTRTPLASLTVFAMHTAVFGGTEFDADFPARLQQRFSEAFGDGFLSVFGEGTAGDVNHVDVTDRHSRSSLEEVLRIGDSLAKTILTRQADAVPVQVPDLAVQSEIVLAPFEPVSEGRYAEARLLIVQQKERRVPFLTLVECWRDCHRHHHTQRYGKAKPLEVQAIRLNRDTAIVTLPHEVFVEIGIAIKSASPFRNTIVMSLANDVDYYIPTRRAFEEGSYEVSTCPLDPGCGELLTTTAIRLLERLKLSAKMK